MGVPGFSGNNGVPVSTQFLSLTIVSLYSENG